MDNQFANLIDFPPSSTLNWELIFRHLPIPTLIIDSSGKIHYGNEELVLFLQATSLENIIEKKQLNLLFVDHHKAVEFLKEVNSKQKLISKKTLLRRFDNSVACVDIFSRFIADNSYFLILQFAESAYINPANLKEIIQTFKSEVSQLNPYLNKHGKELLAKLAFNKLLSPTPKTKSSKKTETELISAELRIKLSEQFPHLNQSEINVCGFLAHKLSIDEIAEITGKTANSLRVSFHRLLQKTDYSTGKELLKQLEKIQFLAQNSEI